ncbi:MAG: hsp90 co-chaperone Cdc37 [Vezdaea aestivalis]|nr:MAG: hsp90 co-chaperone Cdc37 [Vezdaea aestivalis]
MVLDYSKWDALELSDDSDIEVHPNVDKRSFIRAKQNQIHETRFRRRHQIETLKYERIVNNGLLSRIGKLLAALKSHKNSSRNPQEIVFQAIVESAGNPADDKPPTPPEGVHSQVDEQPTYSKMMGALMDQVKTEVDKSPDEDRFASFLKAIEGHQKKVEGLQKELEGKLAELESEEGSKITSDSIHTGFDSSSISKSKPASKPESSKVKSVEVLNPKSLDKSDLVSSGAEADIEEGTTTKDASDDDDAHIEPSEMGKEFSRIKIGDYQTCLAFISSNPDVVRESETDGLLVSAFNSQLDGKGNYAKQCVHQALLLQYCRSLGRDGVGLFFKRITTPGHQAQQVFNEDVNATYTRIKTRAAEIAKEREAGMANGANEQIQLHAVDPNTTINIKIPPVDGESEAEKQSRQTFESFPPGLQRALESASLDEVNKVLGKMSVEEAEEVVGQLGEGGMLSLEEQIIDATTEEGQKAWKEYEEQEKVLKKAQNLAEGEPNPD